MAETLKNFDWDKPSELTTTEKAVYPWEQWLDGDIWELRHGEDFHTHPLMMERIIRTRATGRRAKVRMRHVPLNGEPWGVIILQRYDITGPSEAKRQEAKAKRDAKKKAAAQEAEQIVKDIKPKAKAKAASKQATNGTPTPTKSVAKTPTKRPARRSEADLKAVG